MALLDASGVAPVPTLDREERLRRLMVRYQHADPTAVEELVRSVSPMLLRFLSYGSVREGEAEDLLQDCWLRVHRARHTYRSSEPVLPWIFAIARHTRLDGYRRRKRVAREIGMTELPERPAPAGEPSGPGELERLLDQLPEGQKQVLVMLKVAGMTLEEVARATESTAGAIKQKAHRAYVRLRELLAERDRSGQR